MDLNSPGGSANGSTSSSESHGHNPNLSESDRHTQAEEIVDRVAADVARATAAIGRGFLWLTHRIREEAEDLWAEAQSIRHGEQK